MIRHLRRAVIALPMAAALLGASAARAQEPEAPAVLPQASKFEGVVGLTLGYRPEYSGASN